MLLCNLERLDGVPVRDERLITLVCSLPDKVDIDIPELQQLLKSRLEARAARADEQVQITPRLLGCWAREELETLMGQLAEAQRQSKQLN